MKNREIFQRDPSTTTLPNDGVVAVTEGSTEKEIEALRYELEHFVCEGQYRKGLVRILESYLGHVNSSAQPAAWVSGFYGSGKSHLLKILRHLWANTLIGDDGATARDLALLPEEVKDALRELDTFGNRCGGLHAMGGTLPSGGGVSPRLAVLSMLFRSKGLPEPLPQAQFCLWLQQNGIYDQVKANVEAHGKDFLSELRNLYVSPVLANALLDADADFAPDIRQVRSSLRVQFPRAEDVTTAEFIQIIRDTLDTDGKLPATVIVLDEIQLYIGSSKERSTDVQEMAEALCKQLDSRVLLIGAGQTALASDDPLLQRLQGRFTIPVELSDTDVETVTRKVVLAKKADKRKPIEEMLRQHSGEIDRQLMGTRIATRTEDRAIIVDDYPLLPVRRRFWEHVLRAVDVPGTASQLRTQLRIVHDAVRETGDKELGTVVPADFVFDQQRPALLQSGVLLREIDEAIQGLDDGTQDGRLAKRLCGLIFLVRKLPREPGIDIGVRATSQMLADLLVTDLGEDGPVLRKDIPQVLDHLVDDGTLIKLEDEYSLQTRESSEWDREFRNRQTRLKNDLTGLSNKRAALIGAACNDALKGIRLTQGRSKEPRRLVVHYGSESPTTDGRDIPVWVRDGWGENESAVVGDARSAGNDSPTIFVYVPKASADDLQKAIVAYDAAKATLDIKGTPTTDEGREARDAMASRMNACEATRSQIIQDVVDRAKVYQGGGNEQLELTLADKVEAAARASMDRLFPSFKDADDSRWSTVINRAKNGDEGALQAVDWSGSPEQHRVCSAVMAEVGSGKQGKETRARFEQSPYGWPRDAVDAALITLHATGHLRAKYKGMTLQTGQLDQAKISLTDFRVESMTLNAKQRMTLRKLFQDAGTDCKVNEESAKASEYLARLTELANHAGGEPPMPERPNTKHLDDLRTLSGSELLGRILEQLDELTEQAKAWKRLAELAAERKPVWERLVLLLQYAKEFPGVEELRQQAAAIKSERRLLEASDPVPDIRQAVGNLLRTALTEAQNGFQAAHTEHMDALNKSEAWQQLEPQQQEGILVSEALSEFPVREMTGEDDLVRALEQTPLPVWKTKIDALPQQFQNATFAAAKQLEPETQQVQLSSQTLRSEADVKKWVAETEKELLKKVKDGPIVIS